MKEKYLSVSSLLLILKTSFGRKINGLDLRFLRIFAFISLFLFYSSAYSTIEQDFDFADVKAAFKADLKVIKEGDMEKAVKWIPAENTPERERQVVIQHSEELIEAIKEGERKQAIRMAQLFGIEADIQNTRGNIILRMALDALSQTDNLSDCHGTMRKQVSKN